MIKPRHILWSALLVVSVTAWGETQTTFERYQVILDRKPFGNPPAAPLEPPVATIPPEQSFARTIRMSALVEQDDGSIRVGLIDAQGNQSFFLGEGESENGIELVSADYDTEEAVLRKGSEMAVLKLSSGEIQALNPQQQQERMNAPRSQRMSYADRRAARERARREAPPQPKYTGEELEKHLQEYQMEVIRQGLPPLPIPLTPEMDDQLVTEGVLPPVQ
ncbi:MAG TPA: hypothetical protein DCZ95_10215 [Verrucomicrobia bacterium]|nr:MAG: hypothetical protein A2X46_08180 [Lentisphaerae bacterium GWF2_57_35]HBA84456.1 hypothetical protein [Verrucomicrobiota bacterium]